MKHATISLTLALALPACGTVDAFRDRSSDVMARIDETMQFGVGITQVGGWWFAGLKFRIKPGDGSDAIKPEDREIEVLSHPSSK